MNQLSIMNRLMILVAVMAAGLLAVASFSIHQQTKTSHESEKTLQKIMLAAEGANQARSAQHHFKVQVQEWKNVLIRGGDQQAFAKHWKAFQKEEEIVLDHLNQTMKIVEQLAIQDKIKVSPIIDAMKTLGTNYREAIKRYDNQSNATQAVDKAVRGMDRNADSAIDAMSKSFLTLLNETQESAIQHNQNQVTTSRQLIIMGGLGTLVLGLVISFVLIRSITKPLGGEPSDAVTIFDRISTGDLSVHIPLQAGDTTSLMAAASRMRDSLASMLRDLRETGVGIAAAAQSMSTAGEQLEMSANAQSEAASAVAAAVEQTSVSISETASNAHKADETVTRTRSGIEKTVDAVRKTADNVAELASMIDNATGDIGRLADSSRKIDGIVKTIKDIANQTNLLALNAAIEAARAGEQGRGFAIVADEVRKLAENTTHATTEISSLITAIQSEVDAAVGRMQSANETAMSTRERVVTSTGALDTANADTSLVTESVRNITNAVREQDIAVQQVAQRIESIAQMTEENTANAASAAETARQLDKMGKQLHAAVNRFKVAG